MANFNVATMEFRKGLNLIYHENTKISVIGLGYVGLPVAVASVSYTHLTLPTICSV